MKKKIQKQIASAVKIFSSFDEENAFEYRRRRNMTDREKWLEFSELQKRRWGAQWTSEPIKKVVSIEKLPIGENDVLQ